MTTTPDYEQIANDLFAHCHHLSRWEEDFLDSVADRLTDGRGLTENQQAKLMEIYNQKGVQL